VSNINSVIISGRLTRDPELRHTPSGNPVVSVGLASERYNKDDAENPYVGFFEIEAWGKYAELVARKAQKGDKVTVEGRLNFNSWEAEDGSKRSKVFITANQLEGEWLYRPADGGQTSIATDAPADGAAADDDIPF
jgi:single-strand DNA-binding protein